MGRQSFSGGVARRIATQGYEYNFRSQLSTAAADVTAENFAKSLREKIDQEKKNTPPSIVTPFQIQRNVVESITAEVWTNTVAQLQQQGDYTAAQFANAFKDNLKQKAATLSDSAIKTQLLDADNPTSGIYIANRLATYEATAQKMNKERMALIDEASALLDKEKVKKVKEELKNAEKALTQEINDLKGQLNSSQTTLTPAQQREISEKIKALQETVTKLPKQISGSEKLYDNADKSLEKLKKALVAANGAENPTNPACSKDLKAAIDEAKEALSAITSPTFNMAQRVLSKKECDSGFLKAALQEQNSEPVKKVYQGLKDKIDARDKELKELETLSAKLAAPDIGNDPKYKQEYFDALTRINQQNAEIANYLSDPATADLMEEHATQMKSSSGASGLQALNAMTQDLAALQSEVRNQRDLMLKENADIKAAEDKRLEALAAQRPTSGLLGMRSTAENIKQEEIKPIPQLGNMAGLVMGKTDPSFSLTAKCTFTRKEKDINGNLIDKPLRDSKGNRLELTVEEVKATVARLNKEESDNCKKSGEKFKPFTIEWGENGKFFISAGKVGLLSTTNEAKEIGARVDRITAALTETQDMRKPANVASASVGSMPTSAPVPDGEPTSALTTPAASANFSRSP